MSFLVVNLVTFGTAAYFGRRTVLNKITCGKLGRKGTRWWPASSVIMISLHLGANTAGAFLVRGTPGYHNAPVGDLILIWASRPRLSWMAASFVFYQSEESMYLAYGLSSLLAEVVMQLIGSYYLGMIVNHARENDYYKATNLQYTPKGNAALAMYGGAVLWITCIGALLIEAILDFTVVGSLLAAGLQAAGKALASGFRETKFFRRRTTRPDTGEPRDAEGGLNLPGHQSEEQSISDSLTVQSVDERSVSRDDLDTKSALQRMGFQLKILKKIILMMCLIVLPFIGQWLFWGGLLSMAGDK